MIRHESLLAAAILAGLVLVIAAPAKTVRGTDGADVLRGTSGSDELYGKRGDDRLLGRGGGDVLVGGPGADTLVGGAGNDRLLARDASRDVVDCGPGADTAVVDVRDELSASCEKVLRAPGDALTFVLAGAGDIAGKHDGDERTARLLDRIDPDVVFTTGDNAYPDGTLGQFKDYYHPTWGSHRAKTRPTAGNHDHHTSGAAGYFAYFGSRAPGPYYSYDLGNWHVVALDTELEVEPGSPQHEWLQKDLAASDAPCTLAYWHKPRFSAGRYGDRSSVIPLWELLFAEKAELVLNGHDHNYQRYERLDPDGRLDPVRGIREIVVGTGGASLYPLRSDSRRATASDDAHGVLRLTLLPSGYEWEFIPVSGSYADSGSASCG